MAEQATTIVDTGPKRVARRVEVAAPAHEVFALICDPRRHAELDGSGTVGTTVSGPQRLGQGAKFSMNMKQLGIPYRITNTVIDFQDDRVIEWRHPFGHTWRWELEEVGPGRTRVTEIFDYSLAPLGKLFEITGRVTKNDTSIAATLDRLRRRFTH